MGAPAVDCFSLLFGSAIVIITSLIIYVMIYNKFALKLTSPEKDKIGVDIPFRSKKKKILKTLKANIYNMKRLMSGNLSKVPGKRAFSGGFRCELSIGH